MSVSFYSITVLCLVWVTLLCGIVIRNTVVLLGGIEDKVDPVVLLAIIVYHRIDAQFINSRDAVCSTLSR